MDFFEYTGIPALIRMFRKNCEIKNKKPIRYISVFLSVLVLLLVIYAFFQLLVPQLVTSIKSIVNSFPEYANNVYAFLENLFKDNPDLEQLISSYSGDINKFINENLMPQADRKSVV